MNIKFDIFRNILSNYAKIPIYAAPSSMCIRYIAYLWLICIVSTTIFFNKRDIGHLLCMLLVFVLSGQQMLLIWAIIDSRRWLQWQRFNAETCILQYSQSFPHDLPRMTSLSSTGGWMTSYTTYFPRKVIMTSQANTPKRQRRTARFF